MAAFSSQSRSAWDRAQPVAEWKGHGLPLPFLVRLRAADVHDDAARRVFEVGHLPRDDLRSAERAGEVEAGRPAADAG